MHEDIAVIFIKWVSQSKHKRVFQTYLFEDRLNNCVKIGKSSDYYKRFKSLSVGNPNLRLLFVINLDVEKQLHIKYDKKRIYGEWFNLNESDIINIKTKFKTEIL